MTTLSADVREMLREQLDYRELLVQMTKRDLLLRYKQTIMGFGWAVFMPLVNTAVFSVIFTRVAPIDVGVPYPLFAFCGLLAWNFFASTLRFSVNSLTSNISLVTKVYFPREILPLSAMLVCLVDQLVGSVVLVALMFYYSIPATPMLLLLPIVLVVQMTFTFGVSLLLAMANLFYRDVKYLFEVVITVWMFATSVLYPIQMLGGRTGRLAQLNPMTPIIDGYRDVLLFGRSPVDGPFVVAAVVSFLCLAIGWLTFHRAEFRFAENV
jgi:ABC-2 type transport system permease protein/lipopolysaccharide transport system permease protein